MNTHLLIVDDEKELCSLLGVYFEHYGCQVAIAHNEERARELLAHRHFDVVLLDWNLAGVLALDLLTFLKEKHPSTPVIVFTGADISDDLLEQAIDQRATYCRKNNSLQSLAMEVLLKTSKPGARVGLASELHRDRCRIS